MNRSKSQLWILWNDEANIVSTKMDDFNFNWTMSYKMESEASIGTYGFYDSEQMSNQQFEILVKSNFDNRKSSSIWMVSNCVSKSRNQFSVDLGSYSNVNKISLIYSISVIVT